MAAEHDAIGLTLELLRGSRIRELHPPGGVPRVPADVAALSFPATPYGADPSVSSAGDVESVLRSRTSERHYAPGCVDLDDLDAVVRASARADALAWPQECGAGLTLAFLTVAWRVEGLAPGCYAHLESVEWVSEVPVGLAARATVLQPEYSEAPALVLLFGNIVAATGRHGDHGYRHLLVRAGAAAHAGWLAALGRGLVGSVFAGFLPDAARAMTGRCDMAARQLLALAVGCRPADARAAAGAGSRHATEPNSASSTGMTPSRLLVR